MRWITFTYKKNKVRVDLLLFIIITRYSYLICKHLNGWIPMRFRRVYYSDSWLKMSWFILKGSVVLISPLLIFLFKIIQVEPAILKTKWTPGKQSWHINVINNPEQTLYCIPGPGWVGCGVCAGGWRGGGCLCTALLTACFCRTRKHFELIFVRYRLQSEWAHVEKLQKMSTFAE